MLQPCIPRSYLTAALLGMSGLARSADYHPCACSCCFLPSAFHSTAQPVLDDQDCRPCTCCGHGQLAVSHADLAALVAAAESVPAAMKQLSGVLPHAWVARLQIRVDQAAAALPAARAQLLGGEQAVEATEWIQHARQAAIQGPAWLAARCACSGCGKEALGLRRCGRCKQAACEWAGGRRALLGGAG